MKKFLLLLCLAACINAEWNNYAGFGDTADLTAFKADSLKYTKAFLLSSFENIAFIAMSNDLSSAGYASDSINYIWGIQNGDVVMNVNGKLDTTWRPIATLDTIDTMTSASFADCDTANVTGYCVQDRNIAPAWSALFRFWCKGLTGNETGTFLRQRFTVSRREALPVRNR